MNDVPRSRPEEQGMLARGLCFALLTGLLEVGLLALSPIPLVGTNLVSRHVVWTAPMANVVFFSPVILLMAAANRWQPGRFNRDSGIWVFAFLSSMVLLLMFPQIHRYAKLALAAGLATAAMRGVRALAPIAGNSKRLVPWIVGVITLLAVGGTGLRWVSTRLVVSGLPTASSGAQNVILLVLDTVRAQSLGLYGRDRPTSPNLDRLGQDGVTFELAFSPSPWTLPAHGSLFTSRPPHDLSTSWRTELDEQHPTLAEVLRDAGYATGGFVANLYYTTREFGLDRGFVHYEDFELSPGQIILDSSLGRRLSRSDRLRLALGVHDDLNRKSAEDVASALVGWLDGPQVEGRPFFAFLNLFDAHEPYLPGDPWRTMFGSDDARRYDEIMHGRGLGGAYRRNKESMSVVEVQAELDAYEASIAYLDDQIGRLLDELDRRGELDETIVIVTSDHGEQFGEHGRFAHGNSLYSQVLWIPLVISSPTIEGEGIRVPDPVSITDLPATIMELVGLGDRHPFDGGSLAALWTPESTTPESRSPVSASFEFPAAPGEPIRSIVEGDLHYIQEADGTEHLYDLVQDPEEDDDLIDETGYQGEVARLRARITEVFGGTARLGASTPPVAGFVEPGFPGGG